MKIKISGDSTIDAPAELIGKYGVGILPLTIVLSGADRRDGADCSPDDIRECVEAGGTSSTSAVSIGEYLDYFGALLGEYDAVIHICISSAMSICYQNAVAAADGLPVHVIDSKNLSSSGSLLVIEAARLAEDGTAPEEIAAALREYAAKIDASFVISTLKYLAKGGRCSAVAALGANLLKLKPCIEVDAAAGTMGVGKKYRGALEPALMQYVSDRLAGRGDVDAAKPIFITRSLGVTDETVAAVRGKILEFQPFQTILTSMAGCTIFNHCGPGTLGILFSRK
ncbi:MAG: DegV family protein [Oscillospiraceae bacterium]|jgi:DegV family protein with EDD domain|nr:DegV family protein [Oscillospiraceae bacterium]